MKNIVQLNLAKVRQSFNEQRGVKILNHWNDGGRGAQPPEKILETTQYHSKNTLDFWGYGSGAPGKTLQIRYIKYIIST